VTHDKVRSYPLSPTMIFYLLCFTFLVAFCDKILVIEHLYKSISKGEIIIRSINEILILISALFLIILPVNFGLIFVLLYILFSKIYIKNYGIVVKYFFKTYTIPWEKIRNCYWQEIYTTDGNLYHFLVIETFEKKIKLGPEWTNREMLMKYIQKEIRKREPL